MDVELKILRSIAYECDIHLTFAGPRLQHAIGATSRLPSLAPLRCARQLPTDLLIVQHQLRVTRLSPAFA